MPAHHRGLAAHRLGQPARRARRLVGQHRQRRLQRVRQVADMGAGAGQHLGGVVEQAVQLLGQRRHLARELALEPFGPAGADLGQGAADAAQRPEAEVDLDQHRHHQAEAERAQRPDERGVEPSDVGLDLGPVGGDREHQRLVHPLEGLEGQV
jgi:hypothetical protein